jgi:hypothetical protein
MMIGLRRIALVLSVLVCLGAAAVDAQDKVNVTGDWSFDVQTDAGPGEAKASLKQDGEKLTGHYSGSTLGEAEVTGTVKGNTVEFSFNASLQGNAIPVSYRGTVETPTTMKGTISITGVGNGTFTATKK